MILDYTHNKIIADTITGKFIECFESTVIPALKQRYGGELSAIQMYEDHISDDFVRLGEFYYPLTVVVGGEARIEWIKWSVSAREDFRDDVPFAYVGADSLKISVAESVPAEFSAAMSARKIYFGEKTVKLSVSSVYPSPRALSGKYSQHFVDMMASALTAEIERMFSLSGLADSGIEINLVYAPATYMEHTSDNVTYRRLSLADKTSAPRDFWVKWTRKSPGVAYTVMDNPAEDDIVFEIGEDVPIKIREREYRFLVSADTDKYRYSMGRKNVTEWRELVKRAIKRGELEQEASENVSARRIGEISDKLNAILEKYGAPAPEASAEAEEAPVMQSAPEIENNASHNDVAEAVICEDADSDIVEEKCDFEYIEPSEEVDEVALVEQLIAISSAYDEEDGEDGLDGEDNSIDEGELDEAEAEVSDEDEEEQEPAEQPAALDEQRIREEIEAKLRLEFESAARLRAEAELEELRRETRRLLEENRRLAEEARAAENARRSEEQGRLAEEARLRERLEAEERERVRLAEAARLAVEEQKRREEQARRDSELAKMRERERQLAEERARVEDERRTEAERIRREAEQLRIDAERASTEFSERRDRDMNMLFEEEKPEKSAPEAVVEYTYSRKIVRLIFRHNVDPNVTARIQEVMASSIKYYGKEDVYIRVKASIPDDMTVILDFVRFPDQESELLINIIKILGNSGLGICKVTVE